MFLSLRHVSPVVLPVFLVHRCTFSPPPVPPFPDCRLGRPPLRARKPAFFPGCLWPLNIPQHRVDALDGVSLHAGVTETGSSSFQSCHFLPPLKPFVTIGAPPFSPRLISRFACSNKKQFPLLVAGPIFPLPLFDFSACSFVFLPSHRFPNSGLVRLVLSSFFLSDVLFRSGCPRLEPVLHRRSSIFFLSFPSKTSAACRLTRHA